MKIKDVFYSNLGTINQNKILIDATDKNNNINRFEMFFSYFQLIGVIWYDGQNNYRKYIHENDWSKTTGKLINKLEPDKKKRVDAATFLQAVDACFAFLNS